MSSFRRAFDLAGACAGLLFFAPVMALAIAAVLVDDGRPLFFRQQRLGYRRRRFSILKIRTMRDGRTTRVGRLLRATGLDELPQFINILAGEMSAVGPRPLTESDVRRLGWTGPEFEFRWEAKPGLTGLAQIVGASPAQDALAFDRAYLAGSNPLLDCRLIALSCAVNVFGKERVQRHVRKSLFARTLVQFKSVSRGDRANDDQRRNRRTRGNIDANTSISL
jgi:lipopolysaccharide/colanic/teichoic acid biosynthesis glycosyltransferase